MRIKTSSKDAAERQKARQALKSAQNLFPPHVLQTLTSMDRRGYVVIDVPHSHHPVTPAAVARTQRRIKRSNPGEIVQHNTGIHICLLLTVPPSHTSPFLGDNDGTRVTTPFIRGDLNDPVVNFVAHAEDLLEAAFPKLEVTDPSYLLSHGGGDHQEPHVDAPAGLAPSDDPEAQELFLKSEHHRSLVTRHGKTVPLSALIALQASTTVTIWPFSHQIVWARDEDVPPGFTMSSVTLQLQPHQMVVFRQDIVHAGDNYSEANARVHVFLDPIGDSSHRIRGLRGETTTQFMDPETFVRV